MLPASKTLRAINIAWIRQSRWLLWLELVAIFIVVPALYGFKLVSTTLILFPLLMICVPVVIWLAKTRGFSRTLFWFADAQRERAYVGLMVKRFLLTSALLVALAVLTVPRQLFDLPRRAPEYWTFFIVSYPLFSVYPQELLLRVFFFQRYSAIFSEPRVMILANAVAFGWMHVVYANFTAILFTLIGGWYFASTYHHTRSLRLVCLEHAMYGILLFTLGYARSFLFQPHFEQMLQVFGVR